MEGGNRKSIRLKGYDYSQPGCYFITICVNHGHHLLGKMLQSEMEPSPAGIMVQSAWSTLTERFSQVRPDLSVVMPNHLHGILVFEPHYGIAPTALGTVIGAYKSITTNLYCQGVAEHSWPRFDARLWHRNYYERIIRSQQELDEIRKYIFENPARWHTDRFNPDASELDKFDSDFLPPSRKSGSKK